MPSVSKNFLTLLGRLSLTGIVVLGGFHFGSSFYIEGLGNQFGKIQLRNLSEKIDRSKIKDLKINIQGVEDNQDNSRVITSETINGWLEPYVRDYSGKEDLRVSPNSVENYLASLAPSVNTEAVDAKFTLENGKAKEFIPSESGRRLNIDKSKALIANAIISNWEDVNLPVDLVEPEITLDKINELGITTLIGQGESDFKGSSKSRVNNIRLGAAKYNGTVVKPGEVFSFNSVLGEVNEQSGFESELVIKRGKLVRESGGGLCQVSTTLFRSAVKAGLPVLERRPHSFPVKYYNPQGFDATIYPRVSDLKFKNDTSKHILIQSRIDGTKLFFDIYGHDDGRKVTLDGPHQYNQKTNGSMKAYFIRKVELTDGSVKEERFDSTYGAPAPLEKNPLE
ncbi:MAG: VanW family protein [Candidatus Colwellbacteria bacterium]|nr:VanW family protein [Candidatus Colwellbacteria bacterium]